MQMPKTHVLLVEDNSAHAKLVMLELSKHESISVERVNDGVEAFDYLRGLEPFTGRPRVDLVLLDLNLPRMDGFELLQEVKNDPGLRSIPIVVLSTSSTPADRARAYELHANSYLAKPMDFKQFEQMIQDLKLYWCDWNLRPSDEGRACSQSR